MIFIAHSPAANMGNSLGGMKLYTDLEDKFDAYQGGFIWDYIDQSLYKDSVLVADSNPMSAYPLTLNSIQPRFGAYGGDFDDRQSDYGFCTNGIVYADRTYSPKVSEAKQLYSNIRMNITNGVLTVENRNLFMDTSGYLFKVTLHFTATETPFEMSVLPYSAYELDNALHREELPNPCYTWVRIAAKQMGVGGDDSWGAPVHQEFKISAEETMTLQFEICSL